MPTASRATARHGTTGSGKTEENDVDANAKRKKPSFFHRLIARRSSSGRSPRQEGARTANDELTTSVRRDASGSPNGQQTRHDGPTSPAYTTGEDEDSVHTQQPVLTVHERSSAPSSSGSSSTAYSPPQQDSGTDGEDAADAADSSNAPARVHSADTHAQRLSSKTPGGAEGTAEAPDASAAASRSSKSGTERTGSSSGSETRSASSSSSSSTEHSSSTSSSEADTLNALSRASQRSQGTSSRANEPRSPVFAGKRTDFFHGYGLGAGANGGFPGSGSALDDAPLTRDHRSSLVSTLDVEVAMAKQLLQRRENDVYLQARWSHMHRAVARQQEQYATAVANGARLAPDGALAQVTQNSFMKVESHAFAAHTRNADALIELYLMSDPMYKEALGRFRSHLPPEEQRLRTPDSAEAFKRATHVPNDAHRDPYLDISGTASKHRKPEDKGWDGRLWRLAKADIELLAADTARRARFFDDTLPWRPIDFNAVDIRLEPLEHHQNALDERQSSGIDGVHDVTALSAAPAVGGSVNLLVEVLILTELDLPFTAGVPEKNFTNTFMLLASRFVLPDVLISKFIRLFHSIRAWGVSPKSAVEDESRPGFLLLRILRCIMAYCRCHEMDLTLDVLQRLANFIEHSGFVNPLTGSTANSSRFPSYAAHSGAARAGSPSPQARPPRDASAVLGGEVPAAEWACTEGVYDSRRTQCGTEATGASSGSGTNNSSSNAASGRTRASSTPPTNSNNNNSNSASGYARGMPTVAGLAGNTPYHEVRRQPMPALDVDTARVMMELSVFVKHFFLKHYRRLDVLPGYMVPSLRSSLSVRASYGNHRTRATARGTTTPAGPAQPPVALGSGTYVASAHARYRLGTMYTASAAARRAQAAADATARAQQLSLGPMGDALRPNPLGLGPMSSDPAEGQLGDGGGKARDGHPASRRSLSAIAGAVADANDFNEDDIDFLAGNQNRGDTYGNRNGGESGMGPHGVARDVAGAQDEERSESSSSSGSSSSSSDDTYRADGQTLHHSSRGSTSIEDGKAATRNAAPLRDRRHASVQPTAIDAEEFARQLSLLTFAIFSSIHVRELLNNAWTDPNMRRGVSFHLHELMEYSSRLQRWAAAIIVTPRTWDSAQTAMRHLLDVCRKLYEQQNYQIASAVLAGLRHPAVETVEKLYEHQHDEPMLSASERRELETLQELMDPFASYSPSSLNSVTARAADDMERAMIPLLSPILGVLFRTEDSKGRTVRIRASDGQATVNWSKMIAIGKILTLWMRCQYTPYTYTMNAKLQEFLWSIRYHQWTDIMLTRVARRVKEDADEHRAAENGESAKVPTHL